jgi:hypothetical protein
MIIEVYLFLGFVVVWALLVLPRLLFELFRRWFFGRLYGCSPREMVERLDQTWPRNWTPEKRKAHAELMRGEGYSEKQISRALGSAWEWDCILEHNDAIEAMEAASMPQRRSGRR